MRIINHFVLTGNKDESYRTEFPTVKSTATSHHFFNKPDVKKKVEEVTAIRDKFYSDGIKNAYDKFAELVASELEVDVMHTKIIRREIKMTDRVPLKYRKVNDDGTIHEYYEIMDVEREPTIKEMQISASELYKRRGSYKAVQRVQIEQDDTKSAEIAKSGSQDIMRVVILSNGERLPIL